MTTLTEARRALLELDAEIPILGGFDHLRTRLQTIATYLDSRVPLNIEKPDILPVAVNPPVATNDIVRPASNFVQMSQHTHAFDETLTGPTIRELITSGMLVEACGKCFKCRNGGRGWAMQHPDPDPTKRCDGAK